MQPHNTTQDIPFGYCHCGCGTPTNKTTRSDPKNGYKKGDHYRYLPGHNPTGYRTKENAFNAHFQYGGIDDCWEWQSKTLVSNGYGFFTFKAKKFYAHRFSWEHHTGNKIPTGMQICHSCDNPLCINPKHLFLGTNRDNVDDKVTKNRQLLGTKIQSAKLNPEIVKEIREQVALGTTYRQLANKFSVTISVIWEAVNRVTWKHVP